MKKYLDWDDIKNDRSLLISMLREAGGQRPLARQLNIDHKSIKYWMEKHDIEVEDYQKDQLIGEKTGEAERKPEKLDCGDYWRIYSSDDRVITISKKQLEEFKALYCAPEPKDRLSLRQCSLELDIPRDELYIIKTAFSITHDDIEFTDEFLENHTDEELVEISKERRKRRLIKKIEQAEYQEAIKENRKFRKKEYIAEKMANKIIKKLNSFEFTKPKEFSIMSKPARLTLVPNITDWHYGKYVYGQVLLGNLRGYNKDIFQESVDKLIDDLLNMIDLYNVEEVVILNYGDGLDDPNGNTYPNQRDHQDIQYEDQFIGYVDSLQYFIMSIYHYMPYIRYSAVRGNHSKDGVNWDLMANMMLKKLLKEYESIELDVGKEQDKIIKVYDSTIIQTHGNNIRNGKYTGQIDILNMIRLAKAPSRKVYVAQGHLHHSEKLEGVGHNWYKLPSMVGGDILSNEMMHTDSRPSQCTFLISDDGIIDEHYTYFD